jgi:hypothetical protein
MKKGLQSKFLEFKQVKNRYTPIVNGYINDFIELEYETNSIYSVTWLNRYEECKTNFVHRIGLENFVIMLHNKYFELLTIKNK